MEKRAQEMTLGTIILIVLGIAVLVFLIFGFSTGWSNLWNKIISFGGGKANVDTIRQACVLACNTQSQNDFCVGSRTVNYEDGSWEKGSCESLKVSKKIEIDSCSIKCDPSKTPNLEDSETPNLEDSETPNLKTA